MLPVVILAAAFPDLERAVQGPTPSLDWFSSVQCALIAAIAAAMAIDADIPGATPPRNATPWWVLALAFALASFDERFQLHNRIATAMHALAPALEPASGAPGITSWGSLVCGGLLILLAMHTLDGNRAALWGFVTGGGCFLLTTVLDAVGPAPGALGWSPLTWVMIEELGEIVAQAFMGWALLHVYMGALEERFAIAGAGPPGTQWPASPRRRVAPTPPAAPATEPLHALAATRQAPGLSPAPLDTLRNPHGARVGSGVSTRPPRRNET